MRVLVQRSKDSSVYVDGKKISQIDSGLVLLVSFTYGDTINEIDYMVKKILNLRIFDDENGIMNKSIIDQGKKILSISQFTLYADSRKGNRPSYIKALKSEDAKELYDIFNKKLKMHVDVETGLFGFNMTVDIKNDGPVTILLEKEAIK